MQPVAQPLPIALASTPPSESGDFRPADLVELTVRITESALVRQLVETMLRTQIQAGMHGSTSGSMTRTVCFS